MEPNYAAIFGSFLGLGILVLFKDTLVKILRFCKGLRLD